MRRLRAAIQIVPALILLIACRDPRLLALAGTKPTLPSPQATVSADDPPPDTVLGGVVIYPSRQPGASPPPGTGSGPTATPVPVATLEPTISCATFDPARTVTLFDCYSAAGVERGFDTYEASAG